MLEELDSICHALGPPLLILLKLNGPRCLCVCTVCRRVYFVVCVCVCVRVCSARVTVHGDEGVPAGPQGAV